MIARKYILPVEENEVRMERRKRVHDYFEVEINRNT